uniref:Uncharacterized protein n=1 Tax=Sphaerodactylus townsendi TaxID=933632 RepID=A0ACB8F9J2_9SAUR
MIMLFNTMLHPSSDVEALHLSGERGTDEPAIEMIKVSHLKQYLAVVFKDKPLELWDIRTCTLLREMSKTFLQSQLWNGRLRIT